MILYKYMYVNIQIVVYDISLLIISIIYTRYITTLYIHNIVRTHSLYSSTIIIHLYEWLYIYNIHSVLIHWRYIYQHSDLSLCIEGLDFRNIQAIKSQCRWCLWFQFLRFVCVGMFKDSTMGFITIFPHQVGNVVLLFAGIFAANPGFPVGWSGDF